MNLYISVIDMFSNDLFSYNEAQPHTQLPFSFPADIDGCSYVWNELLGGFDITLPQCKLFFAPEFFSKKISDRSVEYFLENNSNIPVGTDWKSYDVVDFHNIQFTHIDWQQEYIHIYGRKPLPRMTAWYGDTGKNYSYSGINHTPQPWNKGLLYIKQEIEKVAQTSFNSVLLNWYRDGTDYMSWHADDEKELGINPVIASVNFGATRDFQLRHNIIKDRAAKPLKITIPLAHGSLLVMYGECQHFWQHCVPKRTRVGQSRFNLTFRKIID